MLTIVYHFQLIMFDDNKATMVLTRPETLEKKGFLIEKNKNNIPRPERLRLGLSSTKIVVLVKGSFVVLTCVLEMMN